MTIRKEELGTIYKIRINDKEIKEHLRVAVDKVLLLHGSQELWTQFNRTLGNYMKRYWQLSDEEKVRILPEMVKYNFKAVKDKLAKQGANYNSFEGHPRPAMFINDADDKTTTVIDVDYFKEDDEVDFPYKSIAEIMKDKSLSVDAKINMCDKYLAVKDKQVEKQPDSRIDDIVLDDLDDLVIDEITFEIPTQDQLDEAGLTMEDMEFLDDVEEAISVAIEPKKTTRQMFLTLCELYPKKFSTIKKSGHVGWHRYKKVDDEKVEYTPTLITNNPVEWQTAKDQYLIDSTINYLSDAYFIRESKTSGFYVYFIRTT